MAGEKRLGLTLGLEGESLIDALELCRDAEELGYTDIWSAEVGGTDGFAPLAAASQVTNRVRLGTAIVPVFTRPPGLLAMHAATLADLSKGRFTLGLGTSSNVIIEHWMGEPFDRPLTRLREYVEVLRELLAGKKVSHDGHGFSLQGFRLQLTLTQPPPIYVAALSERACRLAGEVADGVIFFMKSAPGVAQALEWVEEGARAAGRDPDSLDRVIRVPVAVGEDDEVLRFIARRLITTYAAVDVYNRSLAGQGYEETERIRQAWEAGDRDAANEAVTDRMIDELMIVGDANACGERIEEFRRAGIRTPVVLPISVAPDPQERAERVRAAVAALAPA
jgi:probable F420-dependent oxidoreductase